MKLDVPFYVQTTDFNCGPASLRMILAFLDKDPGIDILEQKTEIKSKEGAWTTKMAIAAKELGFKTHFISLYLILHKDNLKLDFYKNYDDTDIEQSKKSLEKAKTIGVQVQERSISLNELLDLVTQNSIPIVLLNWKVIMGNTGCQPHFVPIVGHDDNHVYIHNSGPNNPQKFMSIKKELFNEARKSKGTDEDILIIHRK